MKVLRITLLVVLLTAFTSIAIHAQDEDTDAEDTFEFSLGILEDGEAIEGEFTDTITARLYGFNATEGDTVTISMNDTSEDGELDPFLVLLGAAGEVIAVDDDSGEASLDARIEAELPATGGYFILASTFTNIRLNATTDVASEKDPVSYELTLTGNTQPTESEDYSPDSVPFFRGEMAIGDGFAGFSNLDEPVFYVLFEGEAGQVIDIELSSDDFDTILHVFGNGGDRIAFNDDGTEVVGNSVITGLELPTTGEYIIFATDYYFLDAINGLDSEEAGSFTGGEFILDIVEQ